ncbi:MAG TPA: N-acetyltransferase [Pirellulales bacterium]|nr:N-acetyltransferase [Pirellulales bacterium]
MALDLHNVEFLEPVFPPVSVGAFARLRQMGLTYFKRFRMEIDLAGRDFSNAALPPGFSFVRWDESLLEAHAETKYLSFRFEIDANVFPCLGELPGCIRLMSEITEKPGFLPAATWLVVRDIPNGESEYCGTIQGIIDRNGMGAVQNLGVVPDCRDQGLGRALMLKSLQGFQSAGLRQVFLEVTSQNDGAIRLYRRMGFQKVRTIYKVVEVAYS